MPIFDINKIRNIEKLDFDLNDVPLGPAKIQQEWTRQVEIEQKQNVIPQADGSTVLEPRLSVSVSKDDLKASKSQKLGLLGLLIYLAYEAMK